MHSFYWCGHFMASGSGEHFGQFYHFGDGNDGSPKENKNLNCEKSVVGHAPYCWLYIYIYTPDLNAQCTVPISM